MRDAGWPEGQGLTTGVRFYMDLVCPVCRVVDPRATEITPHLIIGRCDECGTTFTIQIEDRRDAPVRVRPLRRHTRESEPSPT